MAGQTDTCSIDAYKKNYKIFAHKSGMSMLILTSILQFIVRLIKLFHLSQSHVHRQSFSHFFLL